MSQRANHLEKEHLDQMEGPRRWEHQLLGLIGEDYLLNSKQVLADQLCWKVEIAPMVDGLDHLLVEADHLLEADHVQEGDLLKAHHYLEVQVGHCYQGVQGDHHRLEVQGDRHFQEVQGKRYFQEVHEVLGREDD